MPCSREHFTHPDNTHVHRDQLAGLTVHSCCADMTTMEGVPLFHSGPTAKAWKHRCLMCLLTLCLGRTCVAVAGNDYCIVASSNRLSSGFSILTRDQSKILEV